jgi:tetratricopeptide (TPR) repeat protein
MPSRPDDRARRSRFGSTEVATGALAIATAAAPLLFGGVLGWTVPVIAALAAGSAVISAFAAWKAGRPMPQGLALVALVSGTLWTAIQAMPLPCGLVEVVSPGAAAQAARTAELFGEAARCTLSEDPGRTREEVLKGLTLLSLFVSASLVSSLTKRDTVLQLVVLVCVSVGAVALAHTVLAATAIYGVYVPVYGDAQLGPFVNPNHLGGLLGMAIPPALGLAASSRHQAARAPWLAAAAFLFAVVAMTLSRGAVLAALGGVGLLGALRARYEASHTREDMRSRVGSLLLRPALLALVPVLVGVAIVAVVAGLEATEAELASGDLSKLELALRSLELAVVGPWVGFGRGAFGAAFVERAATGRVRFEHAENFVAQWAVDWGIVFGPAVALALTFVVVRAILRADRPHLWGALAGVSAYAAQNLVDFGTELLGSAAVATVLLAAAVADHVRSASIEPVAVRRSVGVGVATAALTLAAAASLGRTVHAQRVEVARATLEAALEADEREAFARTVRGAAAAHPREPIFPLLAGAEAARHGEARALAFLNRAMVLAPAWISPRIVAARFLAANGHYDQALLEMREALERDPELSGTPACQLLSRRPTAESVLRMAARNDRRRESLVILVNCLPGNVEDGDAVDLALLETEPSLVEPRLRMIDRALRGGRPDAALELADRALAGDEAPPPVLVLARARALLAAGRPAEARHTAEEAEPLLDDPWQAVVVRARALATAGDWGATREAIGELRGLAGSEVSRLADAEILLGELEAGGGHRGQALAAYEDAWRTFERLDALIHVERLSRELGDEGRAAAARRTLCEREVPEYCGP